MFESFSINVWAVLVVAAANMVVGALWYSPILFGNVWLRLVGKSADEISRREGMLSMGFSLIPAIVSALGLAVLVAVAGAVTVVDAVVLGTLASLVFFGMAAFNLVVFEDRSLPLTILNVGYAFVSWNIGTVVFVLWR